MFCGQHRDSDNCRGPANNHGGRQCGYRDRSGPFHAPILPRGAGQAALNERFLTDWLNLAQDSEPAITGESSEEQHAEVPACPVEPTG
jgi:hypothetical protein